MVAGLPGGAEPVSCAEAARLRPRPAPGRSHYNPQDALGAPTLSNRPIGTRVFRRRV